LAEFLHGVDDQVRRTFAARISWIKSSSFVVTRFSLAATQGGGILKHAGRVTAEVILERTPSWIWGTGFHNVGGLEQSSNYHLSQCHVSIAYCYYQHDHPKPIDPENSPESDLPINNQTARIRRFELAWGTLYLLSRHDPQKTTHRMVFVVGGLVLHHLEER
jgi:hypothetical protein